MIWLWTALAAPTTSTPPVVSPPSTPPSFAGIAGCWQTTPGGAYEGQETWLGPVEGVMVGALLGRTGHQVTWEQLRIGSDDEGWALWVQPKGQSLTRFGLTSYDDHRWVFAHPTHDFPQRVTYERDGETLVVTAEAQDDTGAWSGITLRYVRCLGAR